MVTATTTSSIQSEASIFLEVLNDKGQRIYSSTFSGTRQSRFPLAKPSDIQLSLGLAMQQAIEQMLNDQQFMNALWAQ